MYHGTLWRRTKGRERAGEVRGNLHDLGRNKWGKTGISRQKETDTSKEIAGSYIYSSVPST